MRKSRVVLTIGTVLFFVLGIVLASSAAPPVAPAVGDFQFHYSLDVDGQGSLQGRDTFQWTYGNGDYDQNNTTMDNGSAAGISYVHEIDAHEGSEVSLNKTFDAASDPEAAGQTHNLEVAKSFAYKAQYVEDNGTYYPAPNATFDEAETVGITTVSTAHDPTEEEYPLYNNFVSMGSGVETSTNMLEANGGTDMVPQVNNSNADTNADTTSTPYVEHSINASGKGVFEANMNAHLMAGTHTHPEGNSLQNEVFVHQNLRAVGIYDNFYKKNEYGSIPSQTLP